MSEAQGPSNKKRPKFEQQEEQKQEEEEAAPPHADDDLFIMEIDDDEEEILEMNLPVMQFVAAPAPPRLVEEKVLLCEAIAKYRTPTIRATVLAKLEDPRVGQIRPPGCKTQNAYVGRRPILLDVNAMERGQKSIRIAESSQDFPPEKLARVLRLHRVPWRGFRRFCDEMGLESSFQVYFCCSWPCKIVHPEDPSALLIFSTFTKKWRVVECDEVLCQFLNNRKSYVLPLVDGQKLFFVARSPPPRGEEEEEGQSVSFITVYEVDISGNTTVTHKLITVDDQERSILLKPHLLRICNCNYRMFTWSSRDDTVNIYYLKFPSLFTLSADTLFESEVLTENDALDYYQFMANLVEGLAVAGAVVGANNM